MKIDWPIHLNDSFHRILSVLESQKAAGALDPSMEAIEYLRLAKRLMREHKFDINKNVPTTDPDGNDFKGPKGLALEFVEKAKVILDHLDLELQTWLDVLDLIEEIDFWHEDADDCNFNRRSISHHSAAKLAAANKLLNR